MGLINGTVTLEENYLNWVKMFEEEKKILKNIFGNLAIEIEHIGSTAIQGLKAKPIVDIAVGVNSLIDVNKIENKLSSLYRLKKEEGSEEILLVKEDGEITYFLIHVMEISGERYKNTILFRDYIRNNKQAMEDYEQLKKDLVKKFSNDRKMYTKSKNDFIQDILKRCK